MSNFTNMEDFIAVSIRLMEKTGKPVVTASQVDEFIQLLVEYSHF